MKGNITMKSPKPTNRKKVNLNLKNLTLNTQWYLLGAFLWFPWLFRDGTTINHNEMFLADLS
jgi:hypothetical protein